MKPFYFRRPVQKILIGLLSLCVAGCSRQATQIQAFRYHENGKQKPVVAFVPVILKTKNYFSWDLSQELTAEIQKRFLSHAELYLKPLRLSGEFRSKLEKQDVVQLTGVDFKEFKDQSEFVVFLELLEHGEAPYHDMQVRSASEMKGSFPSVLTMKMRVHVYDLRGDSPKAILREVIQSSHVIPKDLAGDGFERVTWGSDAFYAGPYGRAHAALEKALAAQIENYVLIAK